MANDGGDGCDDKRLYLVGVRVDMNLIVVASSKEEADLIARDSFDEEFENGGQRYTTTNANVLDTIPPKFERSLPWGVPDSDHRRNWTVEQWLDQSPGRKQ